MSLLEICQGLFDLLNLIAKMPSEDMITISLAERLPSKETLLSIMKELMQNITNI